jgi:hypothetical protein
LIVFGADAEVDRTLFAALDLQSDGLALRCNVPDDMKHEGRPLAGLLLLHAQSTLHDHLAQRASLSVRTLWRESEAEGGQSASRSHRHRGPDWWAPKGTPADVLDELHTPAQKELEDPKLKA